MKILVLEHPRLPSPEHFNDIANTPLWSCLMAGYACSALQRAGHAAELLDLSRAGFAETEKRVLAAAPDMLAVNAVYFWESTGELLASLSRLRRAGMSSAIVLFGFFPSLCWQDLLKNYPQIDYVAAGEPEETLVELAGALESSAALDIPGLALRRDGNPMLASVRASIKDLDALAVPARPSLKYGQTVSILASRGCYNGCSFCLIPAMGGGRNVWRGRSPRNVAEELGGLRDQGKTDFYFVDPNFIGPGRRGKERNRLMASALGELNITFGMECRASDLEPGLIKDLARAGLNSLLMGLESGAQDALDRMGKNSTPAQNLAAIEMVRQAGLEPEIGFIMFEPGAALDDLENNLAFLQNARLLDRLGRTANLLCHHQIALKGTGLYTQALRGSLLEPAGFLGFEGRLTYQDPRVAWLAEAMRRLSLKVLGVMGEPDSGIHWSGERAGCQPFDSINGLLVEQFRSLLSKAWSWSGQPDPKQAQAELYRAQSELDRALIHARDNYPRNLVEVAQ